MNDCPLPLRRKAMRLAHHDYSSPGFYFVTIVVRQRRMVLGRIIDDRAVPSALGAVVEAQWSALPQRFDCVRVGMHVVMPNHVHALVELLARESDMPSVTLSHVVGVFKSFTTLRAREGGLLGLAPLWQRGFHERVVRDGREHAAIERYIEANPFNWARDPENVARA